MKSPLWFVVAGVVALAGFAAAILYVVPRIGSLEAPMQRVVVPGSFVLDLTQVGAYTIYHEDKTFVDGQYYESKLPSGIKINLINETTGAEIELRTIDASVTYQSAGRRSVSILAFNADKPGRYRLSAGTPLGQQVTKTVLSIQQGTWKDFARRLFRLIGGAFAIGFGGLALAGAILGVTIWQRMKAKKA